MQSVGTRSANWKLAQFQVTDTISQINPTNWTAEQEKILYYVVISEKQEHCKIILSYLYPLQINIILTGFPTKKKIKESD